MGINHSSSDGPDDLAAGKRSYEKPSFRFEEVFVTSALSCIKAPNETNCKFGPKKVS